ncbi:MAG: MoxR family ATPase [bacterium]|nr:MoxR family ATPase [bacterium]
MSETTDAGLPEEQPEERQPAGPAETSPEIERAAALIGAMREQIQRAVIGQDAVVDQVLTGLLAGGHVLLEGVPGLGKTLLVLALARTFRGKFARIQFTPDLMPSDVTGHAMYDVDTGKFRIRRGPAFTNLLLADEINRAPAKTQAALLEVMQEARITIEGEGIDLDAPFMTLATQNPIEQEGTYPLPEAQLDRFLLKVRIDYPGEDEEVELVRQVSKGRTAGLLDVDAVEAVASPAEIAEMQEICTRVTLVDSVVSYAVRVARETRVGGGIDVGAGPRGALALIRAARARALMAGRGFVMPDDVKDVSLAALRHRVAIAPELELEGRTTDDVLQAVLARVEAPRT